MVLSALNVRAVIHILYGQNPEAQQAANLWMVQLPTMPGSWEVALELLEPGETTEVQFMSAQV
jgi:hypothetical protein